MKKEDKKKLSEERGNRMAKHKEEQGNRPSNLMLSQTLLDLILGGSANDMGVLPNAILNIIGGSGSGKSFLAVQTIYEIQGRINAGLIPEYDTCTHIYRDGEKGCTVDPWKMGWDFDLNMDLLTDSIEGVFCEILESIKKNKSKKRNLHIEIIDSLDSYPAAATLVRGDERKKAHDTGKEYNAGSYLMDRPRFLSMEFFPTITPKLLDADVLLIILSQTRHKIGITFGNDLAIAGGDSLQFYSSSRLLIGEAEKIRMESDGELLDYAKLLRFKTLKVRHGKPYRTCYQYQLYQEVGFDNVFSNVLYLYNLITDKGKIRDDAASRNLVWGDTGGSVELTPDTKENVYEFLSTWKNPVEGLKKNTSKKGMLEFIEVNSELKKAYEDKFGTGMDAEALTQYIYANNLEEELARRVIAKWEKKEEAVNVVGRKKKW